MVCNSCFMSESKQDYDFRKLYKRLTCKGKRKVKMYDPCPCGSGKKVKFCCMKDL
jgi:uncharacterized protein YecA (UPF0149 family)